jgi:transposase
MGTTSKSRLRGAKKNERDFAVLAGFLDGDSNKVLAERHGITKDSVNRILRSQGVKKKRERAVIHKHILEMLGEGLSVSQIQGRTGETRAVINWVRKKNGFQWSPEIIHCRICGEAFSQKIHNQSCCSDECSVEHKRLTTRQRDNAYMPIRKKCEFCGSSYPAKTRTQKYRQRFCNISCAIQYAHSGKGARNQEMFYLRHVQGLTYRRIGEIFGVSRGTAKYSYLKELEKRNLRLAELGISN